MISLKQSRENYDLELVAGVVVTVRPLTTLDMTVAQAAAKQQVSKLEESFKSLAESGMPSKDAVDFDDPNQRQALYMDHLIKQLAFNHIVSWQGIECPNGGENAELNRENVNALMDMYPVGEGFYSAFTIKHYLMLSAKEELDVGATGTSKKVAASSIAKDVKKKGCPAPKEK